MLLVSGWVFYLSEGRKGCRGGEGGGGDGDGGGGGGCGSGKPSIEAMKPTPIGPSRLNSDCACS
jgi:hypothetical protein